MDQIISIPLEEAVLERTPKDSLIQGFLDYLKFGKKHSFLYSWEAESKGKRIKFRKFRTLDSDTLKNQTSSQLKSNGKVEGQETYNGFTEWMRKNNLDEIPQLWNLAIGQIGIIGPRPNKNDVLEEIFTGEDLRLRKKYQANAINMDYAFQGKTWEETVKNGTEWLRRIDSCYKRYGVVTGSIMESALKAKAVGKFFYNRIIKGKKSE